MKLRLLALLLVLALLAACAAPVENRGRDLTKDIRPPEVENQTGAEMLYTRAAADAAAADFTVRLLQNTARPGENALVSPWSVLCALGMAANGAAGDTLAEMTATIGLPPDALGAYLYDYAASLPDDGCLHAANGIWLRDAADLTVEADFLQKNADFYNAAVKAAPFDGSTVNDINAFVKQKTDGQVEKIIENLKESTMLVLVNALGFDAEWETVYREDQIGDGIFTASNGAEQTVQMMHSTEGVFLADGDDATGFLKYYAGGRYAFTALLPAESTTVEDYLTGLTGDRLTAVLESAQEAVVFAGLPKFESAGHYNLNDALAAMGMPGAFTPDADFSAMGHYGDMGLCIGEVLHETSVTVDERGTKAGAATAVTADAGRAMMEEPQVVVLDRPFVYLLLDTEWNLPLFIGTVQTV